MSVKGAMVRAKTQMDDAVKNHDLPQKKLLSVEAQHISRILENCISQIQIALSLPAILHLNTVSSAVDEELSGALEEHRLIDERLAALEGLKQESEEGAGEAREKTRAQLEKDIKDSVRDLLRLFRAHPDAIFCLRAELGMEAGETESKLIRGLQMFHGHVVEKLLASVDEELQLALYKPTPPPPTDDLKLIIPKEEEVAETTKQVDAKISQKKMEIENLQKSLQGNNTEEVGMSPLSDKQCQPHIKASKKQASLQQEIDQLNMKLNSLILENRQAERLIQEKNEKVETEIEYLLQNFDDEIEENQADLELNEGGYAQEEEELTKLEKPFSVLEVECNQVQERRRLAEEKRQKEMRELELKTKAAIYAQAWWRGHSTRKALKNRGKSKKAKKGKRK